MTQLTFASAVNPTHSHEIKLDIADVLAVQNLGFQALTNGTFAHRRAVYTATDLVTVWELSKGNAAPPSIATLDKLGGKPFVQVARSGSYGSANSSDLATANAIIISTAPEDLVQIKKLDSHGSQLAAGTGVNGSFTTSAKPQTLAPKTVMHYAQLQFGENGPKAPVAHLDGSRFTAFKID